MKTFATGVSLLFLATYTLAVFVTSDRVYDNPSGSLVKTTSCATPNGIGGHRTFGSLPAFPNIGGTQFIEGFDSPNCGTCWGLTFNGTTIHVLAIDHDDKGFNIGAVAFNRLTQGSGIGTVDATAVLLEDPSHCGV